MKRSTKVKLISVLQDLLARFEVVCLDFDANISPSDRRLIQRAKRIIEQARAEE